MPSSDAPARCLARAAASARCARTPGSSVSATARSRNAAAAARPPRACARPAERSSSAATSSSGPDRGLRAVPGAAIGIELRVGRLRQRPVHFVPVRRTTRPGRSPSAPADGESATRGRVRAGRPVSAGAAASGRSPSRSAARHSSAGSPIGSAAATSSSSRVCSASASSRRRKLSSIRLGSGTASGNPNPPASCVGREPPRQLQQRQRVAARLGDDPLAHVLIHRPPDHGARSSRASPSRSPSNQQLRQPAEAHSFGSRLANRMHDRLGRQPARHERQHLRRRPVQPLRIVDHAEERTSSAASESRLSAARPTRKRSGGDPALSPKTVSRASRWGAGRHASRSSSGVHS